MNDQDEARKNARQFAWSAYSDAVDISTKELEDKLGALRNELSAKGTVSGGAMFVRSARLYSKQIDDLVLARLDGLLEGYKLYQVVLNEQLAASTIEEVMALKDM